MEPGQIIKPTNDQASTPPEAPTPSANSTSPTDQSQPEPQPPTHKEPIHVQPAEKQPEAIAPTPVPDVHQAISHRQELEDVDDSQEPQTSTSEGKPLFSWEASEYLTQHRTSLWYIGLAVITAILVLLMLVVMKEILGALVVVMMAAALFMYARKPPRTLRYALTNLGIMIGQRLYPYTEFRAFALVPDKAFITVELEPLKRFMPRISLFLDRQNLETVVDVLTERLPRDDRQPDLVDQIGRYLKF